MSVDIEDDLQELNRYKSYEVDVTDYQFSRMLGKGTYGNVWLGLNKYTGWNAAVKELITKELDQQQISFFKREVEILIKAKDTFLLDLIGFTTKPPYSILTSYMQCGSLWDMIHNHPGTINGTQKTNIALGIAHAMRKLHAKNIIHRDLKSPNILLDEKVLPKVADFGLGRFIGDDSAEKYMTKCIGTPIWMAPEQIHSDTYDKSVDVYAFGMILYEMFTEVVPFKGYTDVQIFQSVEKHLRPELPSVENQPKQVQKLATLISLCWADDPSLRPSFEKIFKLFSRHVVAFPSCQPRGVDALLRMISESDEHEQIKEGFSSEQISSILEIRDRYKKEKYEVPERISQLVRGGDISEISKMIVAIPTYNVNAKDSKGYTPLHIAAILPSIPILSFLLDIKTINPNVQDDKGRTPAMLAIKVHTLDVLIKLIEHPKTDVNIKDHSGHTIAHYSVIFNDIDVLKVIMKNKNLDLKIVDKKGNSPLEIAKQDHNKAMIDLLSADSKK